MLGWLRLDFRLQRFEILALLALVAVLAVVTGISAVQLGELREQYGACYVGTVGEECAPAFLARVPWEEAAHWILRSGWVVPFLLGTVLGVPIVAREVEHRTGAWAWTLSLGRVRWLLGRVLPILLVVAIAAGAVGLLAELAASAANTNSDGRDLSESWLWFDQRGLIVPARAVALLCIGLAVGAMVGRILPALLVSAVLSVAVFAGTTTGMEAWRSTDTVAIGVNEVALQSAHVVQWRVRAPDGRLLAFDEADAARVIPAMMLAPTGEELGPGDDGYEPPPPGYVYGEEVALAVPGERYQAWVLRESAVWTGLAAVALCGAWAVVRRRRPA